MADYQRLEGKAEQLRQVRRTAAIRSNIPPSIIKGTEHVVFSLFERHKIPPITAHITVWMNCSWITTNEGYLREPPFPISVRDEIDGHEAETEWDVRRRSAFSCFQSCHHVGNKGLWGLPSGLTSDAPNCGRIVDWAKAQSRRTTS